MLDIRKEAAKVLKEVLDFEEREIKKLIEIPPDPNLGDLAVPCFSLGEKPKDKAKELKEKIKIKNSIFEKAETKGPYLNFFLDRKKFGKEIIKHVKKQGKEFGKSEKRKGEKAIIDMIATNPNKPPHIGHSRNSCLSDTLARCMQAIGYEVTRQTYSNDLGLPTAAVFWAVKNLDDLPKKKGKREDFWQGEIYAKIMNLIKEDEKIKRKCQELLVELEKNRHSELAKEQREFARKCTMAQDKTWERLNVNYDLVVNESDIVTSGIFEKGMKLLKKKDYLKEGKGKNTGCLVFKLEEFEDFKGMENPNKILVRENGAGTYTGKDVALTLWKSGEIKKDFKYKKLRRDILETGIEGDKIEKDFTNNDKIIWVVASEQDYVILVDRYALKVISGEESFENSYHFSYGMVGFKGESKISSREGANALATDLIVDKAKEILKKEIKKRHPDFSEEKVEKISEKIAVGAVRYYLIKTDPNKDIDFSFDEALSFEGETGPYLQYSLVRAKKILDKSDKKPKFSIIEEDEEFELLKKINNFPKVVENVSEKYKPHLLANYSFDLATLFSRFYEKCPVLQSGDKKEKARLALVKAFIQTMRNCLELLGIPEVDVM